MLPSSMAYKMWSVVGASGVETATFLSRDAMHSADYAVARCQSIRLSVGPSVCHTIVCHLSKRLNISSNFFTFGQAYHHIRILKIMSIFRRDGGVECREFEKSRFSTNISLSLGNDTI